jgi:hypothetical protein
MNQKKLELTPEEQQLILKKREKEKFEKQIKEDESKPKKVGVTKHNLYCFNPKNRPEDYDNIINESEKEEWEAYYESAFELIPPGTEIKCWIECGQEIWSGSYIDEKDSDWAKENLINIQDIK